MLKPGDPAPDFEVQTDTGGRFRLSALRGRKVVLYFYPKAGTPGCTIEAREFRDAIRQYEAKGAVVLGISPDSPKAQANFRSKECLPFTLLCDPQKSVAESYGVLKEKNMYGRKVMGVERTTFLIAEDGTIQHIFAKVRPAGHAAEVLSLL